MAQASGLSKSTVQRVWSAFGLQSHRQRHFKISTDPLFIEKVRDVVGLYLNPPDNAVVLCVDEKSQCPFPPAQPRRACGRPDRTPYGRRGWAESDAGRRRFRALGATHNRAGQVA